MPCLHLLNAHKKYIKSRPWKCISFTVERGLEKKEFNLLCFKGMLIKITILGLTTTHGLRSGQGQFNFSFQEKGWGGGGGGGRGWCNSIHTNSSLT